MVQIGYVYSFWSGEMTCREVTIVTNGRGPNARAYFTDDRGGMGVHREPKKLYNAIVWLEEKDDALGASILIRHQQQQIAKLQKTMGNRNNAIQILKEVYGGREEEF